MCKLSQKFQLEMEEIDSLLTTKTYQKNDDLLDEVVLINSDDDNLETFIELI